MKINNKKQFLDELKRLELSRHSALVGSSIYYRDMLYDAYKHKVKALGFFKRKSSIGIVLKTVLFLVFWLWLVYTFGNRQIITIFCLGCILVAWCAAFARIYDDNQEIFLRRKYFAPDLIKEFTRRKDNAITRIHLIQSEIEKQKADSAKKVDNQLQRIINGLSKKIKCLQAEIDFLKKL